MPFFLTDTGCIGKPRIKSYRTSNGKDFDYDNFRKMLKDGKVGSNASLEVIINATHSGTLVNRRVYPGRHMQDGTLSWVTPYPKPVLDNHPPFMFGDDNTTVLGRIPSAEYVRLLESDAAFDNDWMHPGVEDLGSGFIRLVASVTNKDGIEGILSGELLTVSSGQYTDSMFCSICGVDAGHAGGMCEHVSGRVYSVKADRNAGTRSGDFLAYSITGALKYDHVAFVNTPAQPMAGVVHVDDKGKLSDYSEKFTMDPKLLDFSMVSIKIEDSTGYTVFDIDGSLDDNAELVDKPRVESAISILSSEDLSNDEHKKKKKKVMKRPGLDAGRVTVSVKADSRKHEEKTLMDLRTVLDAVMLQSLVTAGQEVDWEGYKNSTGLGKEVLALLDTLDETSLTADAKELVVSLGKDRTCLGPKDSLPVNGKESAESVRRVLRYARIKDKAIIDSKVEKYINPEVSECSDREQDTTVAQDKPEVASEEVSRLRTETTALRSKVRNLLIAMVMDTRKVLRKPGFESQDGASKQIELLRSRSIESLEDTLADLRSEVALLDSVPKRPDTPVENPAAGSSTEEAGKSTKGSKPIQDRSSSTMLLESVTKRLSGAGR